MAKNDRKVTSVNREIVHCLGILEEGMRNVKDYAAKHRCVNKIGVLNMTTNRRLLVPIRGLRLWLMRVRKLHHTISRVRFRARMTTLNMVNDHRHDEGPLIDWLQRHLKIRGMNLPINILLGTLRLDVVNGTGTRYRRGRRRRRTRRTGNSPRLQLLLLELHLLHRPLDTRTHL